MKKIFSIITVIVVLFVCMLIADQGNLSIAVNGSNIIDLVYLIIFVFIVNFFVNKKSWSPKAQKEIKTAIIVYCCFNFYMVSTNFGIICIKKSSINARQKACFSNIRVLQGAVEMYNMDHSVMMEELDIPTLIKEKYLKEEPSKPELDCYYINSSNLSKDGFVICSRHLAPEIQDDSFLAKSDSQLKEYCKENNNSDYTYEMLRDLRNKIDKARINTAAYKTRLENSRPIHEKIILFFKRNKSTIKAVFSPFLILFFPFTLHPLRD
ncbi:MAG: hypothetical protein II567_03940 [Candidatus Riflebacteria bacterium]|nr:hypothetical protein [Candidatus Riflebacteria bacterium]